MRVYIFFILMGVAFSASSQDRYRGSISGSIKETNGNHFAFYGSVDELGKEQKFYYSQHSGQRAAWTDKVLIIDGSQENKYSILFKISERKEDVFQADVKIFEHFIVEKSPGRGIIESKLIHQQQIKGELNSRNEFSVVNSGEAQFQLSVNIDREFTLEEIRQRHKSGKTRKLSSP
ncbi:MAG: hypothetical protein OQK04_11980 [Kangiellaceae bacterium]|nr:hypothetical protein [Kangiellaceae bacterium]MCW8999419.1 hypothetical protein [Kangiellaceae bacterium]